VRPRERFVRLANLIRNLILILPFLFEHIPVRIIQAQLLLKEVLKLTRLDSLHGELPFKPGCFLQESRIYGDRK
jgi:hypothetical protein